MSGARHAAKIFERAVGHHRAGRLPEAEADYRRVLEADSGHTDSLHLLGVIATQLGRADLAAGLIGSAIRLQPFAPDYHNNLGIALSALDRLAEAEASFREAIRLQPDFAEARNNLGNALKDMGRLDEAERCYSTALKLKGDYAAAHNNLGTVLAARERLEEAEACYRRALAFDPRYPEAFNNLANVVRGLGRLDEAEAGFRQALDLAPHYAEAHYNLAWVLLLTGQYEEGWREFEWRWRLKSPETRRQFAAPLWQGEPLDGRTLLLHAEQGAGDSFMFCRYAALAAARGRIVLEVPKPLVRLFRTLPVDAVVATGETLPPFDLHCPLLSLPLAFGTTVATIPAELPYLRADPALAADWRSRLEALPGLRVGLVWAGNPNQPDDHRRSLASGQLAAFADLPGISFVSLQKDAAAPAPPMADWTGELGDYADTAALIDGLDLVVGVDTGIVHLAAALGKPVWLLNRFDPYFAWLTGRADSPWYPGLRQFRQSRPGDWDGVLQRVRSALAERAGAAGG
ncbi:MAG TPA: tetratricopeptide repeat-containing glycosyltransferase family protein [Aliidongia sp.]|nr:tetratricopeptide repeat-containing glycosyltransferase family protein [Aliidongia sp.]